MRIAVPDRPLFSPLVEGDPCGHDIIRAPQAECEMLLRTARTEIALISPLGFGRASTLSDYRIIGTTCLVVEEGANLAAIRFRTGLEIPRTYYAPDADDFFTTVGLLLLAEQHELHLDQAASAIAADTIISWNDAGPFPDHPATIDLTEEWWLAVACGLPLGVWVCRSELADESDVRGITAALARPDLPEREYRDGGGVYQWRWNDEARMALSTTLEMLYYHQFIPEIPAINVV